MAASVVILLLLGSEMVHLFPLDQDPYVPREAIVGVDFANVQVPANPLNNRATLTYVESGKSVLNFKENNDAAPHKRTSTAVVDQPVTVRDNVFVEVKNLIYHSLRDLQEQVIVQDLNEQLEKASSTDSNADKTDLMDLLRHYLTLKSGHYIWSDDSDFTFRSKRILAKYIAKLLKGANPQRVKTPKY